ncbi:head GIN domain-containing protein [uncultured Flavobacterium sp.]|uniref:head GIN domain-containing protein n=1 Tax=uncultured Flavobacterium sp. TaxID=165435 RepID=UPI0030CA2AF4
MKNLLIITFVLLTQITLSQVTRDLGDFDSVKVFDKLNVKLIPSTENKVIINGNREDEVEVVNKNGELKLRMPFPKLMYGDDIIITLFFKKIETIGASEGTYVSCDKTFEQTSIDLDASEGAEINLDLDVEKVNVRAVTRGVIELSGDATNQNVIITSGGIFNGKDLQTSQTTVSVSAGGQALVFADLLVDAKVKAGGSISIYGKPKQINQKIILGGTIKEMQ